MEALWSLCIEEHFYLLFPFLFLYFRRIHMSSRKQAGALLAACLVALLWRTILILVFHSSPKWTYSTTDCRFDSIVWGCILAIHNNPWFGDRKHKLLANHNNVLALLGFAGLLISVLYRDPAYRETARYTLQGLSLYPIFYYCIAADRSWFAGMLQWKPLRWLGTLSYSLYLCHLYIITELLVRFWPHHRLPYGIASFGLSLAFALVMRHTVELPLRRLRQSFRSERRSVSVA
jgi:peptidoglycan/LPS O-acetylase OafA/YrhL